MAARLHIGGATLINGNCLEELQHFEHGSVQCCVTSPPYWDLRAYGSDSEIGAEATPEIYLNNLFAVFRHVRNALSKNGTCWVNMGDSYARNGGVGQPGPNARVGNTKRKIQNRNCRVPKCWGLKSGDLLGMPWRFATGMVSDGWYLRSCVVWRKNNAMPESVRNRPANCFEYVFLFSKSQRYFYDSAAVRSETGGVLRNVWTINTTKNWMQHPAAFPIELPTRCVLLSTRPGDIVLDPFVGSGATLYAAIRNGRRAIGIDSNERFCGMLADKLKSEFWGVQ